jgi:diguanylate cyclase (GGDEF)-like protein
LSKGKPLPKIRLAIQKKLLLSHFLVVLLVTGGIGTYFYLSAAESLMVSLKNRLQNSAAMISQIVDAGRLSEIKGPKDIGTPVYQELLHLLRSFRRANPDIAFLYLMRREGPRVVFVVDSDETPAQALPGRAYPNTVPALWAGFDRPSVDNRFTEDEWGSFMSGYAPLKNGAGTYLVGLDMRADEVQRKFRQLRWSAILSLAASLLLAFLFSRLLSSHFNRPIRLLVNHCAAIAQGRLGERLDLQTGDELDHLIASFNTMSRNLEDSLERNRWAQSALKKGQEELEQRVEERTRELTEVNERLLDEIRRRRQVEDALSQVARTDPLTGLMNRRAMLERFEYQLSHYQRNRIPFAILLGDIDHFKQINDTCGHAEGDRVLISIAEKIRENLRSQDLLARWGGEEFLILLPDTDLEGGITVAEKIRLQVARSDFGGERKGLALTISFGVACYLSEQRIDDCVRAADEALYRAKQQGRNRVVAAEAIPPTISEAGRGFSPSDLA